MMNVKEFIVFLFYKFLRQFSFLNQYSTINYYYEIDFIIKRIGFKRFFTLSKNEKYEFNYNNLKYCLRFLTSDFLVFYQIIIKNEYSLIKYILKTNYDEVIWMIDCGGNIGLS
ncbi:MAG: hypothetical protein LPJ98_04640, partial [Cyclobacteriaceae bacterium]|nr:hypothetical protein [Cyclobacteriaceae bacterium]